MQTYTIDPEFEQLIPPLTDDERAALAESVKAEGCHQMTYSKTAWVKLIRQIDVGDREDCLICGKHSQITHAHHIIPVAQMAHLLSLCDENILSLAKKLKVRWVWLCPNHHAYWHKLNTNSGVAAGWELSDAEIEAFNKLYALEQGEWETFYRLLRGENNA